MKLQKKYYSVAFLFLLAFVLLFFTPIGSRVKGSVGGLLSHSKAMVKTTMQTPLDSYDWQLEHLHGFSFDFGTQKGEVILINFWATWCPPCVKEMPSLQKLYDAYGDEVSFMFVAQDKPERVEKFLEKKGYSLPVYYSKSDIPSILKSRTLPTTYIIDRSGKIIKAETNSINWYSTEIKGLLDDLISTE